MDVRPLRIEQCVEFTPVVHGDVRGSFHEWFRGDEFEAALGRRFDLRQANLSVSRRGVVRGVHFSDVPRGQAKYVVAVAGDVLDFAVDLRVGSPTFGQSDVVRLDELSRRAVFLAEGIGHAFVVLSDTASLCYLTTDVYRPEHDRSLSPLDPALGLDFELPATDLVLSDKDAAAPTLAELEQAGLLPTWEACQAVYAEEGA
jgi:dTDP-4-dehydrorhamnose 3,5-epimerase